MAIYVNDTDFEQEVIHSDLPVMVDFYATWCGPCKLVAPSVEEISTEMEGKAKVVKVDVDQAKMTATRFNIMSIPTLLFFKNGKVVDQVVGAVPKDTLQEKMSKII